MPLNLPAHLIKSFVQNQLGCQCPESVFDHIESTFEEQNGLLYQRLLIGGRLLIYLHQVQHSARPAVIVDNLVDKGLEERRILSLNRFRLVLVGAPMDTFRSLFQARIGRDEKAHLHQMSEVS